MKNGKVKQNRGVLTWILLFFLLLYSIILVGLLVWAIFVSLKTPTMWDNDKVGMPVGAPWDWQWINYIKVFKAFTFVEGPLANGSYIQASFFTMAINSLLYAGGGAFVSTFACCIGAYLTARYKFKFSKVVYLFVVIAMVVPIIGSTPSMLLLLDRLGLYQTLFSVYIMKFNFLDMYFLVFFAVFDALPKDYAEASKIDGASEFQIMFKIMLPLALPTFATVMLIKFIELWNGYDFVLLYLRSYPTLSYGIYKLQKMNSPEMEHVTMRISASLLVAIPILALFIAFRNKIMGNVTMGGVKE